MASAAAHTSLLTTRRNSLFVCCPGPRSVSESSTMSAGLADPPGASFSSVSDEEKSESGVDGSEEDPFSGDRWTLNPTLDRWEGEVSSSRPAWPEDVCVKSCRATSLSAVGFDRAGLEDLGEDGVVGVLFFCANITHRQ